MLSGRKALKYEGGGGRRQPKTEGASGGGGELMTN